MDLGGGSTQVTYELNEIQPGYKDFIHTVPVFNTEVNVFTNSYLGLGLMALRHAVITYHQKADNQTALESECVNPIVKDKSWIYQNIEYSISGKENKKALPENPEVDYDLCVESVKRQVMPLLKPKPIRLQEHIINAFSYYYDRAIETGMVDPFLGGEVTVADFAKKARESCASANTDQPFMCLDLVYISVLLQDGFGLKPQTNIRVSFLLFIMLYYFGVVCILRKIRGWGVVRGYGRGIKITIFDFKQYVNDSFVKTYNVANYE